MNEFQAGIKQIVDAIDRMAAGNATAMARREGEPEIIKRARKYIRQKGPFTESQTAGLLIRDLVEHFDAITAGKCDV